MPGIPVTARRRPGWRPARRRVAASESSREIDPRPGSTVTDCVAVLAMSYSLTGFSSMPWLSSFWISEKKNSCCNSIRPRSLPSPTPCRVRASGPRRLSHRTRRYGIWPVGRWFGIRGDRPGGSQSAVGRSQGPARASSVYPGGGRIPPGCGSISNRRHRVSVLITNIGELVTNQPGSGRRRGGPGRGRGRAGHRRGPGGLDRARVAGARRRPDGRRGGPGRAARVRRFPRAPGLRRRARRGVRRPDGRPALPGGRHPQHGRRDQGATDDQLRANLRKLAAEMLAQGITTFECKSGYGLTVPDEARSVAHRR